MSKSLKNKPRLGRGLSSLISVSDLPVELEAKVSSESNLERGSAWGSRREENRIDRIGDHAESAGRIMEIPLDSIRPNPHQPRKVMNDAGLAEMAASLKSTGLIQPVIVKAIDGGYELIAGERRWRAAKLAGLTALPAFVRQVDPFTQAQMALIENIQREDLNPIDRAGAYRSLMDQLGLTQAELAGRIGEDRSSIANFLRLLELAEPVRAMVRDGRLSLGHAKIIAGVTDILEQERLGNLVLTQELSVRNLERLIQQEVPASPAKSASRLPSAHLQDLEKNISRQLGMRVEVRSGAKKGRGRITIHYGSLDQFDVLLERLGVAPE